MNSAVLLVRHATHNEVGVQLSGRSEIGLSEEGRAQAARLAARLRRYSIDAIHSSPRRRAIETAEIIAGSSSATIEPVEALDEIDFGVWAGASFASLDADPQWRRWNQTRGSTAPPGGESMANAADRAVAHVEVVAARSELTLLVTHCDIIRGVVARYLGLGLDRILSFDVDPASLTILNVGPSGGRLVVLNERS